MRTFFTLLTLLVCMGSPADAQQIVKFNITDGVNNNSLKSQIEYNVTQFLTEVNRAGLAGRALQLAQVRITDNAVRSLSMLWNNLHFVCVCLKDRAYIALSFFWHFNCLELAECFWPVTYGVCLHKGHSNEETDCYDFVAGFHNAGHGRMRSEPEGICCQEQ